MSGLVYKPSAKLRQVAERASHALGHVYALAASSVLERLERFEDVRAERSYHQRAKPRLASVSAPARRSTAVERR